MRPRRTRRARMSHTRFYAILIALTFIAIDLIGALTHH